MPHFKPKNLSISLIFTFFITISAISQVGIGNTDPKTQLDVDGSFSLREGAAITLSNGLNSDLSLGATSYSFYRITGPTSAFSVSGIIPETDADGQIITLVNTTDQPMTIVHNSGTAENRVYSPGETNLVLSGRYSTITLQYNTSLDKWLPINSMNGASDDWKTTGNASTTAGTNFVGTTDDIDLVVKRNNIESIRFQAAETVVNEDNLDIDFRVETELESELFFINANDNQIFVKGNTQHLGYIDAFNAYANTSGSSTIGIQYAISGWNQGNQGGGGNFVIEDVTNPFAAMEASTEGTGIANRGLITSTTSAAIATSGTSNDSNSWGVYGSVPTTGTWLGYGGIFTGGIAYANGVYNVSDSRAKRDIKEISSTFALDKILNIKGYTYKYDLKKFNPKSAEDTKTYYGFMAQNIKEFLPHSVALKKVPFRNEFIEARSSREDSGKDELLNVVDYTSIIPVLVEAMKEQQAQIELLKTKISELENK
ncbi:MAG: tail fiber domain-containing protein [Flavobacteriaceae bacterium]|nr:tail fiber domain-containing protein [Flavobacteriaceae bacterium]